jgi:hypothetical protein
MANPQKAKGSSAERAVVDYLRAHGFPHAERRLAGSSKDRGDIAGMPGVVVEVKNCERTNLAGWLAEAEVGQANDRADYGVVWHKRRGRGDAGQWYATLPAAQLVQLLRQAGYGNPISATEELQNVAPTHPDTYAATGGI